MQQSEVGNVPRIQASKHEIQVFNAVWEHELLPSLLESYPLFDLRIKGLTGGLAIFPEQIQSQASSVPIKAPRATSEATLHSVRAGSMEDGELLS